MQLLFQADFNPAEDGGYVDEGFWRSKDATERARSFTETLVRGVLAHQAEIDGLLTEYAEHWDLHRMSAVDRNVMRVALFEMMYLRDIPPAVSINEAVDIAKQFSGEDSGRFVNGLLDRVRKELNRPAREAGPALTGEPGALEKRREAESAS